VLKVNISLQKLQLGESWGTLGNLGELWGILGKKVARLELLGTGVTLALLWGDFGESWGTLGNLGKKVAARGTLGLRWGNFGVTLGELWGYVGELWGIDLNFLHLFANSDYPVLPCCTNVLRVTVFHLNI
jgi:hypothetical protein